MPSLASLPFSTSLGLLSKHSKSLVVWAKEQRLITSTARDSSVLFICVGLVFKKQHALQARNTSGNSVFIPEDRTVMLALAGLLTPFLFNAFPNISGLNVKRLSKVTAAGTVDDSHIIP